MSAPASSRLYRSARRAAARAALSSSREWRAAILRMTAARCVACWSKCRTVRPPEAAGGNGDDCRSSRARASANSMSARRTWASFIAKRAFTRRCPSSGFGWSEFKERPSCRGTPESLLLVRLLFTLPHVFTLDTPSENMNLNSHQSLRSYSIAEMGSGAWDIDPELRQAPPLAFYWG